MMRESNRNTKTKQNQKKKRKRKERGGKYLPLQGPSSRNTSCFFMDLRSTMSLDNNRGYSRHLLCTQFFLVESP